MTIKIIKGMNIRNLGEFSIEPCSRVNVVVGDNGAGKTALLEGIFIAGRGRSFRSTQLDAVVERTASFFWVYTEIQERGFGPVVRIGVRREGGFTDIRIGGESVKRVSELVRFLPIQIITPRSHEIFERGPQFRRRYLDWGLFHVEPQYGEIWARYAKALRQRNASLKILPDNARIWERELNDCGQLLDNFRRRYVESVCPVIQGVAQNLLGNVDLRIEYKRGWEEGVDLATSLDRGRDKDRKRGYTCRGPHVADLRISWKGADVQSIASRGESKMIISALLLGQAAYVVNESGCEVTILVDDLPAELDKARSGRFVQYLEETGLQCFVTATSRELVPLRNHSEYAMFHVEQGRVEMLP